MAFLQKKLRVPAPEQALPGRAEKMPVAARHAVLGNPMLPPYPDGLELACFGLGCFWGAERKFWQAPGVWTTAVGLRGRLDPEPELRGGVQRPHRPHRGRARGVRPGAHRLRRAAASSSGRATTRRRACARATTSARSTARRSTATATQQLAAAEASRDAYAKALGQRGHGGITSEIREAPKFYFAEDYHQQYLHKNPGGYCGLGGTGVSCPVLRRDSHRPVCCAKARSRARPTS